MGTKSDQKLMEEWLSDSSSHPGVDSYKPDEMIGCANCNRVNPPNRLDCMYCGIKLVLSEEQGLNLKPILRKTDTWKNALNVIYLAKSKNLDESSLKEVARMTRLDIESLQDILASDLPLPLVRSEQEQELGIVSERLREIGFETTTLSDGIFELEKPTRRLRKIEFGEESIDLHLFNSGEIMKLEASEVNCIVSGALFERRVESSEKHSRKKENKILETAETSVDEPLIDIYSKTDSIGFRISAKGFDFSCLGAEKSLVANENMKLLTERLRSFATGAAFDNNYLLLRGFLSNIWEIEETTDSKGLKRKGFGGYKRETVTSSNNNLQFTKYSRLQWHLK